MFKSLKKRVKDKELNIIEQLESEKLSEEKNEVEITKVKHELQLVIDSKEIELSSIKKKYNDLNSENNLLLGKYNHLKKSIANENKQFEDFISSGEIENLKVSLDNCDIDEEFQELRRGKLEALQILQNQHQEKLKYLEEEKSLDLQKVENIWKEKLIQQEVDLGQKYRNQLICEQEEMSIAIELQDLQKKAAISTLDKSIQLLESENNILKMDNSNLIKEKEDLKQTLSNLKQSNQTSINEYLNKISTLETTIFELMNTIQHNKVEYEKEIKIAENKQSNAERNLQTIEQENQIDIVNIKNQKDEYISKKFSDKKTQDIKELMLNIHEIIKKDKEVKLKDEELAKNIESLIQKIKKFKLHNKEILDIEITVVEELVTYIENLTLQNIELMKNLKTEKIQNEELLSCIASLNEDITFIKNEQAQIKLDDISPVSSFNNETNTSLSVQNNIFLTSSNKTQNTETTTNFYSEINTNSILSDKIQEIPLINNVYNLITNERIPNETTNKHISSHEDELIHLRKLASDMTQNATFLTQKLDMTESKFKSRLSEMESNQSRLISEFSEMVEDGQRKMAVMVVDMQRMRDQSDRIINGLRVKLKKKSDIVSQLCEQLVKYQEISVDYNEYECDDQNEDHSEVNGIDHYLLSKLTNPDINVPNLDNSMITDLDSSNLNTSYFQFDRKQNLELEIADKDKTINQLIDKIGQLNKDLSKKSDDFTNLEESFWKLQKEAKTALVGLKEHTLNNNELHDAKNRINELEILLSQQTEELEYSKNEVQFFKNQVKHQFEEQQAKVKFMIERMQENCEQSLSDRDNLLEIKIANLEREKNLEKQREVSQLSKQIEIIESEKKACEQQIKNLLYKINIIENKYNIVIENLDTNSPITLFENKKYDDNIHTISSSQDYNLNDTLVDILPSYDQDKTNDEGLIIKNSTNNDNLLSKSKQDCNNFLEINLNSNDNDKSNLQHKCDDLVFNAYKNIADTNHKDNGYVYNKSNQILSNIQLDKFHENDDILINYEYLRNVLYEYMLGKETKTLAKVICMVMKFNAEQTNKILMMESRDKSVKFFEEYSIH